MDVFFKHEVLFQSRLAFELDEMHSGLSVGSPARAPAYINACVLSALAAVTHSSSICCFTSTSKRRKRLTFQDAKLSSHLGIS
jgi:hypothetical protein